MSEKAMRMVVGAVMRCSTGLNVRTAPDGEIVAALRAGVLMRVLAAPLESGWVHVEADGWTLDGKTLFFEPDVRSGVKLETRGGWRFVTLDGFVASRYLTVVDGPAGA